MADPEVHVPPLRVFATVDLEQDEPEVPVRQVMRRLFASYWPLLIALGALGALVVSDLQTDANAFWREHQVITSLVTGMALTAVVVFGVDRVLRARSRRRWKPMGVRVVGKLNSTIWIEEMLYYWTLSYCQRAHGAEEIPAGESYSELLLEALEDRQTWEASEEVPALVDLVDEQRTELEEIISVWAPVMISESDLAAIAASAESLLEAVVQVAAALSYGDAIYHVDGPVDQWEPGGRLAAFLFRGLNELGEAAAELNALAIAYR